MKAGNARKKVRQKRELSLKSKRRRFLVSLLLGMAVSGIGQNLRATEYENVIIDSSGKVTVKGENTYTLFPDEYVSGTEYPNLTFETKAEFINGGGIGYSGEATADSVGNIDALKVGGFTNNGQIDFTGTLKISSSGLINNGQINGNIIGGITSDGSVQNGSAGGDSDSKITGKIWSNGEIKNYGILEGLDSTLTTQNASVINSGLIKDYSQITANALDNLGTITGVNISLETSLMNSGSISASEQGSGAVSAASYLNQADGIIKNFQSITAQDSLMNLGTIDMVSNISANTSLSNNGIISNVEAINAQGGLINKDTLENIGMITGSTKLEESSVIKMSDLDGAVFTPKETKFVGSLTINGGTLQVRLTPAAGNETIPGVDNDFYNLENADLTVNGGVISVVRESAEDKEFSAGDRYTVIKGKDITVKEALTVDGETGDQLLRFVTDYDNNNYYLDVTRAVHYGITGTTNNSINMGNYIDTLGNNYVKNSNLSEVLLALDQYTKGDPDVSRYALSQLDGAVYGSMATMEVQNMTIVNNTLTNYLRPKNVLSVGSENDFGSPALKMWGTYYGVDGYAKSDGNAFGGDYSVSGVLVGGDRQITPNFRLGGFFAFGDTEYQVNGLSEQAEADTYKAGLYFVHEAEKGYLLGNFNYGWDNFNMTRNIAFLGKTNTAETTGKEWAFRIEKGFNWTLEKVVFQPFGAFQYLSLNTSAFSEEGAGAAALNIDQADYNSYRSEFGGRLLWGFQGASRTGNLFFQTSWIHEYGNTYGTVSSSFSNPNNASGVSTPLITFDLYQLL